MAPPLNICLHFGKASHKIIMIITKIIMIITKIIMIITNIVNFLKALEADHLFLGGGYVWL